MELTTNSRVWRIWIVIFLILTLIVSLLFYFSFVFIILIVGVSLIVFTEQVIHDFKKKADKNKLSKFKRKIYGTFLIIFWVASIVFIFSLSIAGLREALVSVRASDITLVETVGEKLGPFIPEIIQENYLRIGVINSLQNYTISLFSDFFARIALFVGVGVIMIPLMFYVYFKKRKSLIKQASSMIPKKFHKSFRKASKDISNQLHEFLRAKVLQSMVLAGIFCIGFYVSGVKGWLILGVLAGFFNIVPYIGPIIGAIPPLIITILTDVPIAIVYVLVTVIIAQGIDNFYLQPFFLPGKVKLDPLLSLILFLVGAQLFGILGMIFAIPVFIVYKIVLKESYLALVEIYD
jgi:predicted PurR-regulated permease PerM